MLGFISQNESGIYKKTPKQTKITAESAFGTVKSSPKEKRCHKNNLLQNSDRFRFRVNSGGKGDLWVSWLYYFLFPITITKGFGFFSVIAYLGCCQVSPG